MKAIEIMVNIYDEKVELFDNADGTIKAVLESSATRNFPNYDIAIRMLERAGFRFW